jgi:hypothetical protein
MKYYTRTDGHVDEKNDVNRCCAVEEKRIKNTEPSDNRKPTNKVNINHFY